MGVKVKVGDFFSKFMKLCSAWGGQLPVLGLSLAHAADHQVGREVDEESYDE
jgi:hypothetical protein